MEKLPMCRICLAENVGMYVVVNRNLHELYEKLTAIPFVTDDSRPILACFFCCAKLKQCYRLLRKCLEAEEVFAQMMNEDYKPNLLINQDHLGFSSGFIQSPMVHISIVDKCQIESIAIKEELPAVCEGQDDIIEPQEEHPSEELEPENLDNSSLAQGVADIPLHHSESDLEDDVPLMEFKTEVEEHEVLTKKRRARETKKLELESFDNSSLAQDVADIPLHRTESDLEDDVPLMDFKTEVEEHEVLTKKRRARETKRATVANKPKLETHRTQPEDAISAELTKKQKSESKVIRTTPKPTSKPGTYFKEPYKCDQRKFNRVERMIQRTGTPVSEKPYKCDVCQRSFTVKGSLTNHIRIHTGEKPYKCDVCQRSFNDKGYFTKHKLMHTGEEPFECDVCQRRFSVKGSLTNHMRIHTGEKPYKCDVCQRSFSVKCGLLRHIRIHTGEKPYKCDVCKRSFRDQSVLTNHIRIHTSEKPYQCDVCKRSFSEKGTLKKHMLIIHTGEKPYKCDVCQRSFSVKSGLLRHIRIHTGEKPYKCDLCKRRFRDQSVLTNHNRIHTGEKPFECDVCQRRFSLKGNIRKHILIHTGV